MCGRTFIMKVPFEGAKLEMITDLESLSLGCIADNEFNMNFSVYTRYMCPDTSYDNGSYICVKCANPRCKRCKDNTNNCRTYRIIK